MAQCNDGHNSSWCADFKPLWQLVRVASITDAWAGAAAGRSPAVTLCLQVAVHHLTADDLSTQVHLVLFTLQLHSHWENNWQEQEEWNNNSAGSDSGIDDGGGVNGGTDGNDAMTFQ